MIHSICCKHVEMYLVCESTFDPQVNIIHASFLIVYKMQRTLPIPSPFSPFSTTSHEIPSIFQVTSTQHIISIPELNGLLISAKRTKQIQTHLNPLNHTQ
jgi:hypothetical protein